MLIPAPSCLLSLDSSDLTFGPDALTMLNIAARLAIHRLRAAFFRGFLVAVVLVLLLSRVRAGVISSSSLQSCVNDDDGLSCQRKLERVQFFVDIPSVVV